MKIQIKDLITEFKIAYNTGLFESCFEVAGIEFLTAEYGEICDGLLRDGYSLRTAYLPNNGGEMDYQDFSDATINFLKSNEYKYKTLYDVMVVEYDPIANYDRTEEWTDTKTGEDITTHGATNTTIQSGGRKQTNNIGEGTNTASVSTFDRTDFKGAQQNVTSSRQDTSVVDAVSDKTSSDEYNDSINWDNSVTHKGRIVGNIGTLTTQQMILSSREVANFSLLKTIVEDWISQFTIGIWCVDTQ